MKHRNYATAEERLSNLSKLRGVNDIYRRLTYNEVPYIHTRSVSALTGSNRALEILKPQLNSYCESSYDATTDALTDAIHSYFRNLRESEINAAQSLIKLYVNSFSPENLAAIKVATTTEEQLEVLFNHIKSFQVKDLQGGDSSPLLNDFFKTQRHS